MKKHHLCTALCAVIIGQATLIFASESQHSFADRLARSVDTWNLSIQTGNTSSTLMVPEWVSILDDIYRQNKSDNKLVLKQYHEVVRWLCTDALPRFEHGAGNVSVLGDRCPYYFDNFVCWFPSAPNETRTLRCPRYFLVVVRDIGIGGYCLSLVSCAVAALIFISCKRLHCARNIIHLHFFIAFILRASFSLMQRFLLEQGQEHGMGLSKYGKVIPYSGTLSEKHVNDRYETGYPYLACKVLMILWNYFYLSSYAWMLMEGVYLHNAVFFVFRQTNIYLYGVAGWALAIPFVIIWAFMRQYVDNHLCWVTYVNQRFTWLIRGPIAAFLIVNFVLFVHIIIELFYKLKNSVAQDVQRHKKLAKSSLILVVIFGVYHFVFHGILNSVSWDEMPNAGFMRTIGFFIILALDYDIGSLQGFFVFLAYCVNNSEVKNELKLCWYRWHQVKSFNTSNVSQNGPPSNTTLMQKRRSGGSLSLQEVRSQFSSLGRSFRLRSVPTAEANTPSKDIPTILVPAYSVESSLGTHTGYSTLASSRHSTLTRGAEAHTPLSTLVNGYGLSTSNRYVRVHQHEPPDHGAVDQGDDAPVHAPSEGYGCDLESRKGLLVAAGLSRDSFRTSKLHKESVC